MARGSVDVLLMTSARPVFSDVPEDPLAALDDVGPDGFGDIAEGDDGPVVLAVVLREEDRAGVAVEQGLRPVRDQLQHDRELQGRRHLATDVGERGHLVAAAPRLAVEAGGLERHGEARGDGRQQRDVALVERVLAVEVLERDDPEDVVADHERRKDGGQGRLAVELIRLTQRRPAASQVVGDEHRLPGLDRRACGSP